MGLGLTAASVYLGREWMDSSHLVSQLLSSTELFILAKLMYFLCSLMVNLLAMRVEEESVMMLLITWLMMAKERGT